MSREFLPARRASTTFAFPFADPASGVTVADITATLGFYDDGRVGEVFPVGPKLGSALEQAARDIGLLTSLLLQYGATPTVIARAMTKNADGRPVGLAGQLAEILIRDGGW